MSNNLTLKLMNDFYYTTDKIHYLSDEDRKFRNAIIDAIIDALENDLSKNFITTVLGQYTSCMNNRKIHKKEIINRPVIKREIIKEQLKLEYYLMNKFNNNIISDKILECFDKIYKILDSMESIK